MMGKKEARRKRRVPYLEESECQNSWGKISKNVKRTLVEYEKEEMVKMADNWKRRRAWRQTDAMCWFCEEENKTEECE